MICMNAAGLIQIKRARVAWWWQLPGNMVEPQNNFVNSIQSYVDIGMDLFRVANDFFKAVWAIGQSRAARPMQQLVTEMRMRKN